MTAYQVLHDQAPAALLGAGAVLWHALLGFLTRGRALVGRALILKGLTTVQNPIALVTAALTLGSDAIKLYQDLSKHDKADAVAAVLDAVPALATVTGKPVADLQAIITPEAVGLAFDLEQDAARVLPLIEAALAKHAAA